jgi:hypothetical protein
MKLSKAYPSSIKNISMKPAAWRNHEAQTAQTPLKT